jgi:hypothetical protein
MTLQQRAPLIDINHGHCLNSRCTSHGPWKGQGEPSQHTCCPLDLTWTVSKFELSDQGKKGGLRRALPLETVLSGVGFPTATARLRGSRGSEGPIERGLAEISFRWPRCGCGPATRRRARRRVRRFVREVGREKTLVPFSNVRHEIVELKRIRWPGYIDARLFGASRQAQLP